MTNKFYLPSKINSYLKRLLAEYKLNSDSKYAEIISASKILVQEGVDYDNWDGGQYGHVIKLFLTAEQLTSLVPLNLQEKISDKLHSDINKCAQAISGEYISKVRFEIDDNDLESQSATHLSEKPFISPDSLSIWKLGCIRLFISHRDKYKSQANELAEMLSNYGISSFVAHDSIEPMEQWQQTILKGLETMELMLTFVTDDFHESYWTNQEIGYALARNIPIISFKLQKKDPAGFIAEKQALKGNIDDLTSSLPKLYDLLAKGLNNQSRMQTALVEAFTHSPDWGETTRRFEMLSKHVTKLSDVEIDKIISSYRDNDQLYSAVYLTNKDRLKKFLNSVSDDVFIIEGNVITRDNLIPF